MDDTVDGKLAQMDRIRKRFDRVLNAPLMMDPSGSAFSVKLPGFKYDDFDRFGHVGLFKLNRFFEYARYTQTGLFGFEEGRDAAIAIVADLRASRSLYTRAAIDFPLVFTVRLTDIGRTSFVLKQTVAAADDGEVLATRFMRLVMASVLSDKQSVRLDERVSAEWAEKLGRSGREPYPDVTFQRKVPAGAFCFVLDEVRLLDSDLFNHTTQSFYIAYVSECAARAGAARAYRVARPDLGEVTAARVSCVHEKETVARDTLQIHTWDDASNPWVVHFVMRKDGETVFLAQIEYHEPTSSRL